MQALRIVSLVLAATLVAQTIAACPEETVVYPKIVVQRFEGKFVTEIVDDHVVDDLMRLADFKVREVGAVESEPFFLVVVRGDGTFELDLSDGTYEYSIQFEQYLFTMVGEVEVSAEAAPEEEIVFDPPWC